MHDQPYFSPYGGQDPGANPPNALPEAQRILDGLLADLPDKAEVLVDKVERELKRLEENTQQETARVREAAEQSVAEIESRAEKRRSALLRHAVEQLEPLQKELFRTGELGQALATFVKAHALKAQILNVLPDPGHLLNYPIGKSYHFRVLGSLYGPVWGSDVYTADSSLAAAAVHAGAIEEGEEAVVKVTLVDMTGLPIHGSLRHGVESHDWGPYRIGYRVSRG